MSLGSSNHSWINIYKIMILYMFAVAFGPNIHLKCHRNPNPNTVQCLTLQIISLINYRYVVNCNDNSQTCLWINKKEKLSLFIFCFIFFSPLPLSYVLTVFIKHIHRFTKVMLITVNKVFRTLQKSKHNKVK